MKLVKSIRKIKWNLSTASSLESDKESFIESNETSLKASYGESNKDVNMCIKITCEDDDRETTLYNNQTYALRVRLCKENEELEKYIVIYKNQMKFLEYENERTIKELEWLKKCVWKSSKCDTCYSLRYEIENFLKTLRKIIMGRGNLDIIYILKEIHIIKKHFVVNRIIMLNIYEYIPC